MTRPTYRCAICGKKVALTSRGFEHVSGKARDNAHTVVVRSAAVVRLSDSFSTSDQEILQRQAHSSHWRCNGSMNGSPT